MTNGVCAVIVTFRPRTSDLGNLALLRPQVEDLVVVDNGSEQASLEALRTTSRELGAILVENGRNLGIAAALNGGVKLARARGCRWVVLLDQDSIVTPGFIASMLADFGRIARQRNILLLVPRYQDPITRVERYCPMDDDGGPFVTITSGSLLPAHAFDAAGFFKEELFIYTVDDEFSLRLRRLGYSIGQSPNAVLLHASGVPSYFSLLGKRLFQTPNYRPQVLYYIHRNRIWMTRTYGAAYPRYVRGAWRASLLDICKLTIAEQHRWSKLRMILLGMADGLRGRMGNKITI